MGKDEEEGGYCRANHREAERSKDSPKPGGCHSFLSDHFIRSSSSPT